MINYSSSSGWDPVKFPSHWQSNLLSDLPHSYVPESLLLLLLFIIYRSIIGFLENLTKNEKFTRNSGPGDGLGIFVNFVVVVVVFSLQIGLYLTANRLLLSTSQMKRCAYL